MNAVFYFIYLFIFIYFGCIVSSLLRVAFLSLWQVGLLFVAMSRLLIAVASHCGARALGLRTQ